MTVYGVRFTYRDPDKGPMAFTTPQTKAWLSLDEYGPTAHLELWYKVPKEIRVFGSEELALAAFNEFIENPHPRYCIPIGSPEILELAPRMVQDGWLYASNGLLHGN